MRRRSTPRCSSAARTAWREEWREEDERSTRDRPTWPTNTCRPTSKATVSLARDRHGQTTKHHSVAHGEVERRCLPIAAGVAARGGGGGAQAGALISAFRKAEKAETGCGEVALMVVLALLVERVMISSTIMIA